MEIKYGLTHVHLESALDSGSLMESFFVRMKELGCPAVCVSEHGVMTSIFDAVEFGKKYGIKVIPGVEAYLKDEIGRRSHLIIYAKNQDGYRDLCQIVTESYKDMEKTGKLVFPIVNMEDLKKRAGNIIITTACINGPLAAILRTNEAVNTKVAKLRKKAGTNPRNGYYFRQKDKAGVLEEKIANLRKEKNALSSAMKKKSFDGDIALSQKKVEQMQEQIISMSSELSGIKAELKKTDDKAENFDKYAEQIAELESHKKPEDELMMDAVEYAKQMQQAFGKDNFFIELQNHFMKEEEKIYPMLAKIAKENDIPVVAANDVHIATNSEEDLMRRQIMRSQRFNEWEEVHPGDKELYIKSDEQLKEALVKIIDEQTVNEAMENIKTIVEACDVSFEKVSHYPKYATKDGETAFGMLKRLCMEGIKEKFPEGSFTQEYKDRLVKELKVMQKMGVVDYHLTVWDFLNFGRKVGHMPKKRFLYLKEHMLEMTYEEMTAYVEADQSENGLFIGPGRGSAAGSLVCYLLGITSLDPIKYNLLFERFLNVERVSMPDIDSDIATEARDVLIEYVRKKYGKDAVCCIVTKNLAKARGAVRAYARVAGSKEDADDKMYLDLADRIAKKIPNTPGITIKDVESQLREEFASNETALSIIDNSLLIEGQLMNYGMHAAGVIISDNENVGDYVPLMWDDNNNVWKCQCDMVQAEEVCGLLKMDFLGLRTLSVITETIRRVKERHGIVIDPLTIPFEKDVFSQIFSKGKTNSVFQFESSGMKQMLQQFKPQCFEDLILLVAAYRPGPMDSIPKIIRSKLYGEKPKYCIPEMGEVLDVTYGYPIYQEQLMDIFHKFAGFSLGEADIVRRYMSKKKVDKFLAFKDKFVNGLVSNGAKKDEAEKLWDELVGFAKYGFNKSHAAAYALVAYQTAWLKYHYPVEYICSELNSYESDKMAKKIRGLSGDLPAGAKILAPDINQSGYGFTVTADGNIIFGLGSIKSVGAASASILEKRPYSSLRDFMMRGHIKKDTTKALINSGAMDLFNKNRRAMAKAAEEMAEQIKAINTKKEKVSEIERKLQIVQTSDNPVKDLAKEGFSYKKAPTAEKMSQTLEKSKEELRELEEKFSLIMIQDSYEDKTKRLDQEKELLGLYISENPLDDYPEPSTIGCSPISYKEMAGSSGKYMKFLGIVSDLKVVKRKKDGKEMAFFVLEDKTGSIECNCFTKEYEKFREILDNGKIITLEGTVVMEEEFQSEDGESNASYKMNCRDMEKTLPEKAPVMLPLSNITEWYDIQNIVKSYHEEGGHPLYLSLRAENRVRKTTLTVSENIFSLKNVTRI